MKYIFGPKIINKITVTTRSVNVLQVLAITSTAFVLFAILWVTQIEDYLEQREMDQTKQRSGETTGDSQS